jgi:hypothetical protein
VCDWKINTALVEKVNLGIRQRVAAIGRGVNTRCQGGDGVQPQRALCHVYHNFVRAQAGLRPPLRATEATNGGGAAKVWQPCTLAMAGLSDPVWSLKEVVLYRVPPWPQPKSS